MIHLHHSGSPKTVAVCLAGVGLSLLLVGIVSGTLIRHIIQVVPIIIGLFIVSRRPAWGAYAAMPLFLFWLAIMLLIWSYLLGFSSIASGHYTVTEIVLTIVMAVLSVAGVVAACRLGAALRSGSRAIAFVCFGLLQFVVMWMSFVLRIDM